MDRAGNVLSLAGKLGRAFQEERQQQRGQVDPAGWNRHAGTFDEFCAAIVDLRDAMQHPPGGFAPVAKPLLEAARIAKGIRDAMQRPDGRTWAAYLEFFPHLNSVCEDGWRAVNEAAKARRLDDPFAFVDQSAATPGFSLLDRFSATPAGHVAFLEMVRDEVRYAADAKRQRLVRGYSNDHLASMVHGIKWTEARQRVSTLSELSEDAVEEVARVLQRELTIRTVEQIDELLARAARKLRDAWENRESAQADTEKQRDSSIRRPLAGSNDVELKATRRSFTGGKMVFYSDRVELCGADICSGSGTGRYRRTLELLAKKDRNGRFTSYSGEALAKAVGISPGEKEAKKRGRNAPGLIKKLRGRISEALESGAKLKCGRDDVILSGGPGYRFSDCLSVHQKGQPETVDIGVTDGTGDVPNDPNDDVRDDPNDTNDPNDDARDDPNDTDDPNDDVRDDPNDTDDPNAFDNTQEGRRAWILERLEKGQRLNAADVVGQFTCSTTTAKRDLKSLKDEGSIEFVGASRTGHYCLAKAPGADQ